MRELLCLMLRCHWTTQQILPGDWITGYNVGPIKSKSVSESNLLLTLCTSYDRVKTITKHERLAKEGRVKEIMIARQNNREGKRENE